MGKKIGRNAPCPCGSGKKYKNCCMAADNSLDKNTDTFSRYNQLISINKIKLEKYFIQEIKQIRKDMLNAFLRFTVNKELAVEHETLYSDYLWLDFTNENKQSFAFKYLKENGDFLEKPLYESLESLTYSYLSIYELKAASAVHMQVIDILTNKSEKILLKEPFPMPEGQEPILLMGRVINLSDANLFSGMVLMLSNQKGEKEFIIDHIKYLQEVQKEKSLIKVLKNNTPVLYGVFDHALKKHLLSLNDIRCTVIDGYTYADIQEKLDSSNNLEYIHSTFNCRWYKVVKESSGYTRIVLNNNHILSCANVLTDILYMSDLIHQIFPDINFEIISSLFLKEPPAIDKADLWFTVAMDQETEIWLYSPQQELENKTPVQILEQQGGKEKLINLLESLSQKENITGEIKNLINYRKERIISIK